MYCHFNIIIPHYYLLLLKYIIIKIYLKSVTYNIVITMNKCDEECWSNRTVEAKSPSSNTPNVTHS